MTRIRRTYLVTIEIDTKKARNFLDGFCDPQSGNSNGFNVNSYPNWDINYLGNELAFIENNWEEFGRRFRFDGLHCHIAQVKYDF